MFRFAFSASFLCVLCHIFDASAIEVATTVPPDVADILKKTNVDEVKEHLNYSRRIINGQEALASRPYMVFLKIPHVNPKFGDYQRWLCGGVIVSDEYVLTSAACIEDAKNFYVVSGLYRHREDADRKSNQCLKNGAKKAIWKCVPRNYVFDGHENDNIRWMNNDIAVVKVDDEFDFNRRIRGCDFIPKPICYNNQSATFEQAGNSASIAGWGSSSKYNDWVNTRREMAMRELLETNVKIITKNKCKRRWGSRYFNIIDNYMICTKDLVPDMTEICEEKYVDCSDVLYSGEEDERRHQYRRVINPTSLRLHNPFHNDTRRHEGHEKSSGGFCENDHGGPLVFGDGVSAMVIGIISACLVKDRTNKCYGPFLYTSVFRNKILLDCAIFKDKAVDCNKMYRSSITHTETEMSWIDHPDGPSKNEIAQIRRMEEEQKKLANITEANSDIANITTANSDIANITKANIDVANITKANSDIANLTTTHDDQTTKRYSNDKVKQHGGIILRTLEENSKKLNGNHFSNKTSLLNHTGTTLPDKVVQHEGLILRTFPEHTRKSNTTL